MTTSSTAHQTNTAGTWRFDRNYKNTEQVAAFMPAFLERFAEVAPNLASAYNDSFKGHVAGIEGPDEDTAIYLLQKRKELLELDAKVARALANGFVEVAETGKPLKCSTVVHYGFYMGGTGWSVWYDVRLVPAPCGMVVLRKGARTHGHNLTGGHVLVKV